MSEVVERLVGHATRHRTVTEHRDDVPVLRYAGVAGGCETVGPGQHGGGVAVLDEVVATLLPARVPREALLLAQPSESGCPSGEDLVHVGLVSRVPQDGITRALEHAVKGDGELHGSQVRPEMPAGLGDGVHDETTDLGGEFVELLGGEPAKVGGLLDPVEQRHSTNQAIGGSAGVRGRPR